MNNFSFDLERMRGAELKAFLSNLQRDREEALAKPTDMSVEEAFERVFDKYKGALRS